MRKHTFITVFILLILTACDYDAPLVGEASLPIDQALLGSWETIPEDRGGQEPFLLRLVIRQESANQYEIALSDGKSNDYAKGWLAELEGIRFIQTQYTGDNNGPVDANQVKILDMKFTKLFSVYSYALNNDELVLRELNQDLVSTDLADTATLQAAFAANRDNPNLFHEQEKFRKLPDGSDNFPKKQ